MTSELATGGECETTVKVTVAADLAVSARMQGSFPANTVAIGADNGLSGPGGMMLALYHAPRRKDQAMAMLLAELRLAYCC